MGVPSRSRRRGWARPVARRRLRCPRRLRCGPPPPARLRFLLAAGADDGGIVIRSAWPETTATRVRCKEESAKGVEEAWLEREAASRCSVTAMRKDRSRITAVVDVVTEGAWVCFEGGAKECRTQ